VALEARAQLASLRGPRFAFADLNACAARATATLSARAMPSRIAVEPLGASFR
jgi:hypothetical protein